MGGIDELYARITDSNSNVALVHYTNSWPVSNFGNGGYQEWNIGLQEFIDDNNNIDLTDVKTLEIGFLDGLGNSPAQMGYGFIYFDDIRLYPRRCILEHGHPEADINDDCVVDWDDVKIMVDDWLEPYHVIYPIPPEYDPNLVAYWKLDGNALDSGPGGHHGTIEGSPIWDPNGIVDGAIRIIDNGVDDYINFGGSKDPGDPLTWADITGEITVTAWIKPDFQSW